MAISVTSFTGTELVGATEKSLLDSDTGPQANTTVGIFQAFVDLSGIDTGDVYEFRAYEKARAADTQQLCYYASFANKQATPVWVSPSMILGAGWDMTIVQDTGSPRTINFSVRGVTA